MASYQYAAITVLFSSLFLLQPCQSFHIGSTVTSTKLINRTGRANGFHQTTNDKQQQKHFISISTNTQTTNLGVASKTDTTTDNLVLDDDDDDNESDIETIGTVVFLLPHDANEVKSRFGSSSPYGNPTILEAAQQLTRKANWFSDGTIEAEVVLMPQDSNEDDFSAIRRIGLKADALIAFNLGRDVDLTFLKVLFEARKNSSSSNMCHFALDCSKKISPVCGPYDAESPSIASTLLPWTNDASGLRMEEQMMGLFNRWNSDDFTVALMLYFNQFSGSSIDWVKYSIDATWEKGPVQTAKEFVDMISKCGDCVVKCVQDEKCKECLDALTAVDTRDQVASYRTVVSYESELLRDFSFCILQKNNIFQCDAKIPQMPKVAPMETFRGKPLTKEVARSILVGHLDDEKAMDGSERTDISWKVAAGANVAYDQFPSQNQIFYEAVNGKSMWYDPVFRVETIDGRDVWCKRHYRVRDGPVPGTFRFSVLDNGVTSDEFWTIVDVADDLSHIIFHYAGAAGAVGQRYLGGLLCTSDGSLPPESAREAIYAKLRTAGIDPWELFVVDNRVDSPGALNAGPPPLDYFRKDVLQKKQKLKEKVGAD